jgi:hypothetical protein
MVSTDKRHPNTNSNHHESNRPPNQPTMPTFDSRGGAVTIVVACKIIGAVLVVIITQLISSSVSVL